MNTQFTKIQVVQTEMKPSKKEYTDLYGLWMHSDLQDKFKFETILMFLSNELLFGHMHDKVLTAWQMSV